jgi:hypothetical protein
LHFSVAAGLSPPFWRCGLRECIQRPRKFKDDTKHVQKVSGPEGAVLSQPA